MIEETHTLKCQYKGVQPFVKVTAYELSSVDCSSDKNSGYYGETATLTANEAPAGYNFSGWNITGSNMTGNSFRFQGDVTAKAGYSAIQYNVTLQNDGHGTIAASKTTGNIGDTVTLSNTPATHYHFDRYATTGATLTGSQFKFNAFDVTAKGFFAADPSYSVTLQTDGHGKIGANKTTGYSGDTVTLSNTASAGYSFKNYTVTGATINGSTLTFGNGNCTAKANYSAVTGGPFTASMIFSWSVQPSTRGEAITVDFTSEKPSVTANFPTANIFSTQAGTYNVFGRTYTATGYIFNRSHTINNLSVTCTGSGSNGYGSKSRYRFYPVSGSYFEKVVNAGGNTTGLITGTAASIQNTAQPQHNTLQEIFPHVTLFDPDYDGVNGISVVATATVTGVLV